MNENHILWKNIKRGTVYTVLSFDALHSETLDRHVAYMNDKGQIYFRPYDLFFEKFVPFEVK